MKVPSINRILSLITFFLVFCNCSKFDKNQITNIEKLTSPNNEYDTYIYNIESGMSFGSAVNALQIVKHKEKPDFYNGIFFRISNSRPFKIFWINNENLILNTISTDTNPENKQPFKTEKQNYKGIRIENNAYTMFSSTAMLDFKFSKYYEDGENLIFKNQNDSLVIKKENSQFSIDKDYLEISIFERNKYDNNKGLAFDSYKLIPENNFDFTKLEKFQPLIIIEK